MGSWLADVARHDAWALWLAAPVVGIALVCLGVWWWSRPARPATTTRSIAGHHAYLDALGRPPRERVEAPDADAPSAPVDPLTRVVLRDPEPGRAELGRPESTEPGPGGPVARDGADDADDDDDRDGGDSGRGRHPTADDVAATVTLHA